MNLGQRIKSFLNKLSKKYSLLRLFYIVIITVSVCIGVNHLNSFEEKAKNFLGDHQSYLIYIIVVSFFIGLLHTKFGKTDEHHLYIFKQLGPLLASPLSCITYGIVINSCFALMYIVWFDPNTAIKYESIDKLTILYALFILIVWSFLGLVRIAMDIISIEANEKMGQLIDEEIPEDK